MKLCISTILILIFFSACTQSSREASNTTSSNSRAVDDLTVYGGPLHPPKPPRLGQMKRKTPNTPTALCHDEHYTFSRNIDFACNGHGGVKQWLLNSDVQIKPEDGKYFED